MPTRISDLSEFYTVSASMYVPIVDLLATGSNKNKKISLIELFKFYQTTSSYTTTTPGFFYFGDNRDGDGNFSSSVQVSSSFSSVTDGDPIIKNFSSLFISESLLVSPTNRCDGMLIFVDGDCIISGSLSMTAKGASGVGIDASFFPLNPPNLGYYWNDVVFPSSSYRSLVSFTGSAGNSNSVSTTGSNGRSLQLLGSGSGYSGGGASGGSGAVPTFGGSGSAGTSFSGGSGGGGAGSGSAFFGGHAALNGGAGGNAGSGGGAGAGNPGGNPNGGEGTGGLLILMVKGNLLIGSSGSIRSNGSNGGNAVSVNGGGGGGSGGGVVYVYYGKSFTSSSSSPAITVTGGIGGAGSGSGLRGGDGGTGSLIISNLYQRYPIIY
jgi:hypothetical protein